MGDDESGRRLAVLDGILVHPATIASPLREQINRLRAALPQLEREVGRIEVWAHHLAGVLTEMGRLLTVGGPPADRLAAAIAGCDRTDRPAFSALHIGEDAGATSAENVARAIRAHGRPGDVLMLVGRGTALAALAEAGRDRGLVIWALTGPGPNALTERCDDAISIMAEPVTVQEVHSVAVDLLCEAFDAEVLPPRT